MRNCDYKIVLMQESLLLLFPWAQPVLGNLPPAGGCLQTVSRGLMYNRELPSLAFPFSHLHAWGFEIKCFIRKVPSCGALEKVLRCFRKVPVQHGTLWRTRLSAVLWPGSRGELSHCWVVIFSEISQWSKPDILLKDKTSDNLFQFSHLKRASSCIWNSLPAKPGALGTSVLCEETLSYVTSHLYYCIYSPCIVLACYFCLFDSQAQSESLH